MLEIGIDVGGTFTDVVVIDRKNGALSVAKTASTPQDQSIGILNGLRRLGVKGSAINRFTHGTTVATNTVLERKGARVAMLTTAGFRDLVEIGRTNRSKVYDMKLVKPGPLVLRPDCHEIRQRTYVDGQAAVPLLEEDVRAAVEKCRKDGIEAIAVCYLHAYADPGDEEATVEIVKEVAPDLYVTNSADVVREYKEYERFSTTTLNAYVMPVLDRYLENLTSRLSDSGYTGPVEVMRSGGGLMRADSARRRPVETLLSGPAAGVMGALHIAKSSGYTNMITYDMGGTSTDVALIADGSVARTKATRISDLPLKTNQIDIITVGAGGGSIAYLGQGSELKVGPESAGSTPGPACYGVGGEQATVTDANLALGRLSPAYKLGGEITLQPDRSDAVVSEIAAKLALSKEEMAEGILKLANTKMASAIREISIERGHDPRDFSLVAYGGAGPMHGAELARDLSIPVMISPPAPGNLSALGLLVTDLVAEQSTMMLKPVEDIDPRNFKEQLSKLAEEAAQTLISDGVDPNSITSSFSADMRYSGQKSDIAVALDIAKLDAATVNDSFYVAYAQRFNHKYREAPAEIVTLRAMAVASVDRVDLRQISPPESTAETDALGKTGARPVHFSSSGWVDCPVYDRYSLAVDTEIDGPAIVEELGSTTVIGPTDRFKLDAGHNIIVFIDAIAAGSSQVREAGHD